MIIIKSANEIGKMRVSSRIAAEVMGILEKMVAPGVRTVELDRVAARLIQERGGRSAFKGYRGYPAHVCISVNEEVVHGIPGERVLEAGDIVSVDVGVEHDGYCGDMARTFTVGEVNGTKARLVEVTRLAVEDAVGMARSGGRLFDISRAIERRATSSGFSVVRDYVGHGIGATLHEDPQIPNFGKPHTGPKLKSGMTFAVEAMINAGTYAVRVLPDGWTVITQDRKASAHFEDTIVITGDGPEVLTCQKRKMP
ncbi:MAG: type I methionyl aminopeptidase [Candidatus Aureabacteria bacterium]|nr:type I methionyl aminopeptidase [Candidatus Auribacterota bacterium]